MKLMLIFGTRPELIKLAPMIQMAHKDSEINLITCSTGQHRQMLDQVMKVFNINPDIELDVMTSNQSLAGLTSKLMLELTRAIEEVKPDVVVVQGDTTSAYIGALAAFYQQIPVAHVEAGLRTGDLSSPFPEELNRAMIAESQSGTLHLPVGQRQIWFLKVSPPLIFTLLAILLWMRFKFWPEVKML